MSSVARQIRPGGRPGGLGHTTAMPEVSWPAGRFHAHLMKMDPTDPDAPGCLRRDIEFWLWLASIAWSDSSVKSIVDMTACWDLKFLASAELSVAR